jgi:serine/threonine-protein kinase
VTSINRNNRDNNSRSTTTTIVVGIIAALIVIVGGVLVAMNLLNTDTTIEKVSVPNLANLTEQAARDALTDANLAIGVVHSEASETVDAGRVTRQNPVSSEKVNPQTKVDFWISTGKEGPGAVQVPDLRNLTPQQAEQMLAEAGLAYGLRDSVFNSEIEAGKVCGQSVAAGQTVEEGIKILYDISKGPEGKPIPSVIGKTREEAIQILSEAGFNASVVAEEYHEEIPRGSVIDQNNEGGSWKQGAEVDLTISKGQDPNITTVPDFTTGMTLAQATQAASAAGLSLDYITTPGSTDIVVTQSHSHGARVARGTTITVTFGPAPTP